MATTEHSDLEQQIIKTAQQLFIEKGFVETSMSDIAATVGINRPTLHYYFRTKDKMFKAVFGSIVMSLMPKIQDIVKQDIPFMERLSMILDEYIELFTSKLKKVPIHIVFLTVYSLLSYPFLAKNLIVSLFLEDEAAFADFLQEWKQNIINQLQNLLCYEE